MPVSFAFDRTITQGDGLYLNASEWASFEITSIDAETGEKVSITGSCRAESLQYARGRASASELALARLLQAGKVLSGLTPEITDEVV